MSVTGIFEQFGDEPTFAEHRAHLFGSDKEIVGGVGGPRKWEVGCRHVSGCHLLEGVAAPRLEDPGDLLVELPLVTDVHADVLHPDNIKRTIGKGEVQGATLVHLDSVLKAG